MTHETTLAALSRTVAEQGQTIELLNSRLRALEVTVANLAIGTASSDTVLSARITQLEVPRL